MAVPSPVALRRLLGVSLLCASASACFGGGADADAPIGVTDEERAAFTAPADSSLTPEQVESYLRISLARFDLLRERGAELHRRGEELAQNAQQDEGVIAGLRNLAEGASVGGEWLRLLTGSYAQAARDAGLNPAEMEYVQERMAAVSSHLMAGGMAEAHAASAGAMQASLDSLREQLASGDVQGMSRESLDSLAAGLEAGGAELAQAAAASPAIRQNLEAIRAARPNVSDAMWVQLGLAGGAMGLGAFAGLGDPSDTTAVRQSDEFRRLLEDAIANRVTESLRN